VEAAIPMMLRGLLFALLLLASFPGKAATALFFQINNGGFVQCTGCFPVPVGTNGFLRFNVLRDDGQQVPSGAGTIVVTQNGAPLISTPWIRQADGGTNTFVRNLPAGTYLFHLDFVPTAPGETASSAEYTMVFATAGSPQTGIAITSTQNPAAAGSGYGITAQVAAVANPVTGGTVNFSIDGVPYPGNPVPVDATGRAPLPLAASPTTVGQHAIVASYNPDAAHAASTSGAFTQTVVIGSSTTTVTSSVNPSIVGQSVTFTATVASGQPGGPGGDVTFTIDGAAQAPVALGAGTTATFTQAFGTPGTHTVSASYSGSAVALASSGSLAGGQRVLLVPTTALASSANPSSYGGAVTLTATIGGTGPTPTGTVQFVFDGGNLGPPVPLDGGGVASIAVPQGALTVGTHPASAVYSGDANYSAGTAATLAGGQVVNPAATTTTLVSSANPSSAGAAVSFTATVASPSSATPSGTVVFNVDGAPAPVVLDGAGQAVFTTSLAPGNHAVTAAYQGSATHQASASTALAQVVSPAATTTSLASSVNPSRVGEAVTFTATVASGYAGTPTGTVTFTVDGAPAPVVLGGAGSATFTTSALTAGTHAVSATYGGDATYATSASAPLTQAVNTAATTTTLASSVNPSSAGQAVTFTATVASSFTGTPTGTVVFTIDGTASAPVALNGAAQAAFTTSSLTAGNHVVTAAYGGDAAHAASTSAPLSQGVDTVATTTSLLSTPNPSRVGEAVTITATVASASGTPAGRLTFTVDGAPTPMALDGAGSATLSTSWLTAGNHVVSATYGGNATYAPSSSAPLTQAVNKSATTTTLASSVNPSGAGQAVTFTATVASSFTGTPTGNVVFTIDGTASAPVAVNGAAQATFTTASLAPGNHVVTAAYGGDPAHVASTSAPMSQAVSLAPSTTTLASSLNPASNAQTVTFTATVTSAQPGVPTGTVTFSIDGTPGAPVALNGVGQAVFPTSSLLPGAHVVIATYSGSAVHAASASTPLTQTTTAVTTTTLTAAPDPIVPGQPVTYTATVGSTFPGTPAGTVTFLLDGIAQAPVALNANGQASFTVTLGPGTHSVLATYNGNGAFAASSSALLGQGVVFDPITIPATSPWGLLMLAGLLACAAAWRKGKAV
jgi:hypothetical protein